MHNALWPWCLIGMLCVSILLSMGMIVASASHGHWTDHYRTADHRLCCGQTDCEPAHLRVITGNDETVILEVAGAYLVSLPRGSLHHSEDLQDWFCRPRPTEPPSTLNSLCAFIAIGS